MIDKRGQYLLIVDDEEGISKALRRELADWARNNAIEIHTALSAKAGMEMLASYGDTTVIVISDLNMPHKKGSDFLLEVKAAYPHIIAILLTGYSDTSEVVKAVSAGIFSYIIKPWDSDYLMAEVQKAYEHGELLRQNALYLKVMEEELKWAGEMQKRLLKPNLPRSSSVEFKVTYSPVAGLYCGGDYYDVILLGENLYLILLGDVAGHGVKAAFVTGILKAIIYSEYVKEQDVKSFSPGAFLSWLNDRMDFEFRSTPDMLLTFLAGVLDLNAATFKYANAGHTHPFLLHDGVPIELSVPGTGIGFIRSITYTEQTINVVPGDHLFLYTDGLVEINNAEGRDPVELKALLQTVPIGADYHRRLMDAALAQSGSTTFTDDISLITASIL